MTHSKPSQLRQPDDLVRVVLSMNDLVERDKGTAPLLAHSFSSDALARERLTTYEACRSVLVDLVSETEAFEATARTRALLDVLRALQAQAEEGMGESMAYQEKVRRFTGVPNEMVSEEEIAGLQDALSAHLARAGYRGSLSRALGEWRTRTDVGSEFLNEATALFERSLAETRAKVVGLPDDAEIDFEPVRGVFYRGYSDSTGPYRAHITLNADLEWPAAALKHVVTHEGCPGHFAISAMRQRQADLGLLPVEQSFFFANTPVTSINEGTCNLGVYLLGWFDTFDDLICLRSDLLRSALLGNMCYLYHQHGKDEGDVAAYFVAEGGVSQAAAEQTMRFVKHPLWHTSNPHYWHGTHRVFNAYHACLRQDRWADLVRCLYDELHTYASLHLALGLES